MSSKTRTRKTPTTAATGTARTLRSVPDQPIAATTARTDTEDKLWEALHAHPDSTATDLSAAAKIGKSTAQKILAKWAADGSVSRTAGIAEGGRRAADLWAITDIDTAQLDATPVDQVDDAPADDADSMETAQAAPAAPDATDIDDATRAESDPTEPTNSDAVTDDTQGAADTGTTDPADPEPIAAQAAVRADGATTDADTAAGAGGDDKARLAPGALRGMVEDYLRDHPGEEFGPTAIATALGGKSSGAVSNALDKLVEDNTAVKTQQKPRRFALAPAEVAAATPTN